MGRVSVMEEIARLLFEMPLSLCLSVLSNLLEVGEVKESDVKDVLERMCAMDNIEVRVF